MAKKVLITGGSGFLGRHIVERLLAEGYKITALARRSNVARHLQDPAIDLVIGDIRDPACVERAVQGVDFIVHAAATMRGAWEDFLKTNVQATETLIRSAIQNKVKRFIYISSVSVYPHASMQNGTAFQEESPYEQEEHTNFYSKSKIEAEKVVLKYVRESNLPAVILRPGAIYGPAGNIFPATLGLGMGESRLLVIGDADTHLPLSYVENVVDAIVRSFKAKNALGECFNLVEDRSLTRNEYVQAIRTKANPRLRVLRFPLWFMNGLKFALKTAFRLLGKKAPLSALNLKLYCSSVKYSNEKYKQVFGGTPFVDFDDSIVKTMQWYRKSRTPKRATGFENGKVVVPATKKLNVGVVGCGNIANVHLMFLKKFENVGNITVADPKEAALKNTSKKFKISRTYHSYREMFQQEQLDVVHILTPPQFHAEIAAEAAKQGLHILVEKPMALDASQAEGMALAARENQVKLCVVHNHLFDKVMIKAREILAQDLLGRITYIESWYGTQYGAFAPPFDPEKYWGYGLPGGLYQDYLPHALYVLLDVLGEARVKQVLANYVGGVPGVETDELKVLFEREGKIGLLNLSLSSAPRYQFMNIYGTQATLKIDFLNKVTFLDKEIAGVPKTFNRAISAWKRGRLLAGAAFKNTFKMARVQQNLFEGTDKIIRLFYRSILLGEPGPVSAQEGLQVMNIMDEIWSKMKTEKVESEDLQTVS
ncbi:MAG: SDR family NAD(P)-dependent oxidoreductase [bacterium]